MAEMGHARLDALVCFLCIADTSTAPPYASYWQASDLWCAECPVSSRRSTRGVGPAIRSPIPCLVHNIGSNNSKSAQRKHCCFSMASVGGRWGFELDASLSRVVWHASANSVLKHVLGDRHSASRH